MGLGAEVPRAGGLFSPPEHVIEAYKNAFLDFRFLDAFKCLILLKMMDEKYTQLYHFQRILFSQAEVLGYHMGDMQIMLDLLRDLQRSLQHTLPVKKVDPDHLLTYFDGIKTAVANEVTESHFITMEGYQARILNLMNDVEANLQTISTHSTLPEPLMAALVQAQKRVKRVELTLKTMANCMMLYASEFLKSAYGLNCFDDPLTIE